jgi:hypothetical protein
MNVPARLACPRREGEAWGARAGSRGCGALAPRSSHARPGVRPGRAGLARWRERKNRGEE